MKIKKEVKAALMTMLLCTSIMTGCQSNKDTEQLSTEETINIKDTIKDGEKKESEVAETDPIDKDTSSNTSSNADKDTSSNTDKDTNSNTSVNKDKDTSSNTSVNKDKDTSSNTSVNKDKDTSSNTSSNADKNTSSNTNVNTDKDTNTSNTTGIQDGSYSINASLSGGAGKVSIEPPVEVTVSNGQMTAKIRLSSQHYTYMLVNGKKYYNVNNGGNSTFIIPISINKSSLNISAETQAMSQPYVIDYTINFDFSPITK